jgi:hypothetical protein
MQKFFSGISSLKKRTSAPPGRRSVASYVGQVRPLFLVGQVRPDPLGYHHDERPIPLPKAQFAHDELGNIEMSDLVAL